MKRFVKRLFAFAMVIAVAFLFLAVKTNAVTAKITVIWSNPGENSSEEVSFSWQSTVSTSKFYFTLGTDTEFANATTYDVTGVTTTFFDTYSYKLEIGDLDANTAYIYKIKSGDTESAVYTVTTAANASDFSFIWSSDMHIHTSAAERISLTVKLYNQIVKDSELPVNLIVGTGDEVAYGGSKSAYEQLTNIKTNKAIQTMMWANIPGNHTYYEDGKSGLFGNGFYETMTNHPDNGFDDASSSYWFIYNSVMFVLMDSLSIQNGTIKLADQQAWFKRVVAENEGKFQYLIVGQHYPWLNALTGAKSSGYYSNYTAWYKIFDECGVDIALAGDYHTYYRSERLYNDEPVALDSQQGTVYLGNRQIGGRAAGGSYYIKDRQNPTYFACRLDNPTTTTSGCGCFTVTSKGIEWKMYDADSLEVVDSCFIPAKRGINWESVKDKVADSTFFTGSGTNGYINFNTSYKDYVDTMEIYNESNQLLKTVSPSADKTSTAVLGVAQNRCYKYTIKYTFVDDTTRETVIYGNTCGDFGEIYGFNLTSNGTNLIATFNASLKGDIVKSFEVRQDGKKIAAFGVKADSNYSVELTNGTMNLDSQFVLNALNSKGDILYSTKKQYTYYGDVNVSGAFDMNDVDAAFTAIQNGTTFTGNSLALNNFNGDQVFDIGDAILMYKALMDGATKIKEPTYTVVFLDFDGNVISTQEVKEGQDAVVPTFPIVEGYTFDYLSTSYKQITSNVVIKAIYKAN